MKITRQIVWKAGIGILAFLCVVAIAVLLVLRSDWFRDEVRKHIVAQVESATGGKVEIGGFDYDWSSLTADLQGFVIHGKELPPAAPLLRVEKATITVRVISLLERKADISSITLLRPQVNLIVDANGETNLPTPPVTRTSKDPIAELFALKLNHFVINNGLAVVADQRVPINVRGDGVEVTANYVKAALSYELTLSSSQVDLGFGRLTRGPLQLSARASLHPDRIDIPKVELTGKDSRFAASGKVDHFAHPRINFQLDAASATNEILPLVKFGYVRGGKIAIRGAGHYDGNAGLSFQGKADAQQVDVAASPVTFKGLNASAEVDAKKSGLLLRHVVGTARGAKFEGEGNIKNYRELSFEGTLSGLTFREAGSFFTNKPLPWQGVAAGRVHGGATLDARAQDFVIDGDLTVTPSSGGIPVSGSLGLRYQQKLNALDFRQSYLNFPHSTVVFSGSLRGQNQVVVNSGDLSDFQPIVPLLGLKVPDDSWPVLQAGGNAHFDGFISNLLSNPSFEGHAQASAVQVENQTIDGLTAQFNATASGIDFASLELQQGDTRVNGTGLIGLNNWLVTPDSPLRAALALHGVNIGKIASQFPQFELPIIQGIASGSIQLRGTVGQPEGRAHIASDSLDAYGEKLNQAQFDAELIGNTLQISKGRVLSGAAALSFSGEYTHRPGTWTTGIAHGQVDTNGFPLASLSPVKKYAPGLSAKAELHFTASAEIGPGRFEPSSANGTIQLSNVTWDKVPYGDVTLKSATHGQTMDVDISGDFRKNPLRGTAKVSLAAGNEATAEINFDQVALASIYSLVQPQNESLFDGSMNAKLRLEGSLRHPDQMHVSFVSDRLELQSRLKSDTAGKTKAPAFVFHNSGPMVVEIFQNIATIRSFRIEGDQTGLQISGTVPSDPKKPMDLKVAGNVNLQAYHLIDPNVDSAGISTVNASIGGTLRDPTINGTLEVKNGSFFPENLPNGLSEVNGTVAFTRNRATLQKMTAKSGGGELALSGFLSFAGGGPLVYHLEGTADNVRVRYAGSISVTVSSKLRLSGTSNNSLLAGTMTISRVIFNANTDVGSLLTGLGAAAAGPATGNEFLSGLHLDVGIESAPNLQLSTALSRDVEAQINLRLRGTPEHPVLLGTLAANQGDIQAFGNRYTINRGEISFNNPVKIEPTLDLNLETRARGVTVDISVSGIFSKLNIAYRSDPPLQPREIIALLSLGRAPDSTDPTKTLRTNDTNTLQSPANSLLGAAVTSPVTNRLSKLFGITNIRIDPLVQGITNTPQTRVTLEQQISRDITITYVTNLSQTSEQIFRFEWAFSRQFSVVALRDDNGEFGIDFQYKKQFK